MESSSELKKGLLLIVDDEEMNKLILMRRLQREGYRTIEVSNGALAVEQVRALKNEEFPLAVLMDINMPVMDGIEATRILKSEFQNLPIIAVTACVVHPFEFERYGFDGLCKKPIDFNDLVKKVRLLCPKPFEALPQTSI